MLFSLLHFPDLIDSNVAHLSVLLSIVLKGLQKCHLISSDTETMDGIIQCRSDYQIKLQQKLIRVEDWRLVDWYCYKVE